MSFLYSDPLESLLENHRPEFPIAHARVVIVGSGYGGAVAAYRLSGTKHTQSNADHDVLVLERGNEYLPGEFPAGFEDLPPHVQVRRSGRPGVTGYEEALFDLRLGDGIDVLVGNGLGGTSLINANVAIRPPDAVFQSEDWPEAIRREMTGNSQTPLKEAFAQVTDWLGVENPEGLKKLKKHQAFARFADALGTRAQPAPVAVTFGSPRTSNGGIRQPACTSCGNCVTGCNVGAKNTLAMNLIPAARARGARFITGATVIGIRPDETAHPNGSRWQVLIQPTSSASRARIPGLLTISADVVVLAAGTIGSTEILKRSHVQHQLKCSADRLGARFSTNGDGIAMAFAGTDRADAIGSRNYDEPTHPPGPTISAVARGRTPEGDAFTLEEGAIPAALAALFGELITTTAQAARLGNNRLPDWFRNHGKATDPISVHQEALQHSQVFLIMSDDGAPGILRAEGPNQAVFPHRWNAEERTEQAEPQRNVDPNPVLSRIGRTLASHDRRFGLGYGQYLHNPLWKIGSDQTADLMDEGLPQGRQITVHPLGGCVMADSAETGVVNHLGQVFTGQGANVHPGLYVMDGAVVPKSLGTNPFLTIAALAWRACDHLAKTLEICEVQPNPVERNLERAPLPSSTPTPSEGRIVVREQLLGDLSGVVAPQRSRFLAEFPGLERLFQKEGVVLMLATEPADTPKLMRGEAVRITAQIVSNPIFESTILAERTYGFGSKHAPLATPWATGDGSITLMATDDTGAVRRVLRALEAVRTYGKRRESLSRLLRRRREYPPRPLLKGLRLFWNAALMQATYRTFDYTIKLKAVGSNGEQDIHISGRKRIAWRRDNPRTWQSLLTLPAKVTVPGIGFEAHVPFQVDMEYLLGDGLVSAHSSQDVICGTLNILGFGARLARGLLQAGFWDFGAPDYPDPKPDDRLPETLANGARLSTYGLHVRAHAQHRSSPIRLQLHRYHHGDASPGAEPVLLIHGLAQSSLIFAHRSLGEGSMANQLSNAGFEVWMLDHRLSSRLNLTTDPIHGWSIDEIGAFDVPDAVRRIRKERPGQRVHVFAHCVGAIGVQMAILRGRLTHRELASVALNAIHPWSIAAPANRVRARAAEFVKDWLSDEYFDPVVRSKPVGPQRALLDRLAFSLARLAEEPMDRHRAHGRPDRSEAICDRMTFTYGRMWRHENVQHLHSAWQDLVGPAPISVLRHLFYMLIHRRVLDRDGRNRYLTLDNVRHWAGIRTLFVHGLESQVYNPQSAVRSARRLTTVFELLERNDPGTPQTKVALRLVPGFGHMDVILAEKAPTESFQYVAGFFQGKFDRSDQATVDGSKLELDDFWMLPDSHSQASPKLVTGPILRGARLHDGKLHLRYWVEVPTLGTSPVEWVAFLKPRPAAVSGPFRPDGARSSFEWYDLELEPDDYSDPEAAAKYKDAGSVGLLGGRLAGATWVTRLVDRASGGRRDAYFIVGSCRHPGTLFDAHLSDEVFKGMNRHLDQSYEPCDAAFFLGDQIYADASAGLFDPIAWPDRYEQRYREAFNSPALKRLLSRLPIHFALDDHEFADDFMGPVLNQTSPHEVPVENRIKHGALTIDEFEFARCTASSFMNSARSYRPFGSRTQCGEFWYPLDHKSELAFPAFILDTRSERMRNRHDQGPAIMSEHQLNTFLCWLRNTAENPETKYLPKLVFSGSALIPLRRDAIRPGMWRREDGFAGYPSELGKIVRCIVENEISRVVFIGGDLHLSCFASIRFSRIDGDRSVSATQIIASGLYAPLRFTNLSTSEVDWKRHGDGPNVLELDGYQVSYIPEKLTDELSHFVKVGITPSKCGYDLDLGAYDPKGNLLNEVTRPL